MDIFIIVVVPMMLASFLIGLVSGLNLMNKDVRTELMQKGLVYYGYSKDSKKIQLYWVSDDTEVECIP